jgi:ferredoxin
MNTLPQLVDDPRAGEKNMAYVVTGACVDCVYTSCVDECPVAAFHEAPDKLLINPETCIDCDACVAACPVEAIHADHEVPDDQQEWIAINLTAEEFPVIEVAKDPLKGPKCANPNAA